MSLYISYIYQYTFQLHTYQNIYLLVQIVICILIKFIHYFMRLID